MIPYEEIIIYSTPGCGACQTAKVYLENLGQQPVMVDILENKEAMSELRKLKFSSVPIIKISERYIEGFNPIKIKELLEL